MEALETRARLNRTDVAEEVRRAVDAYLELQLLDAATRRAAADIAEMNDMLAVARCKAERVFAELERLRGGPPEGAA